MSGTPLARVLRAVLFVVSLALIVVATLTPGGALPTDVAVPDFWCVACEATGGADLTANLVLFVPLGVSLALLGVPPGLVLGYGTLLTVAIECAQGLGFPGSRVANVGDVISNATGALVGGLAACNAQAWLRPAPRRAGVLATAGTVAVCAVFAVTAWALGPVARPEQVTTLEPSTLPFAPGFGWFHGRVSVVRVGGESFPHAGDGPVILRGAIARSLDGEMRLSGRDERASFVPMLYVHEAGSLRPALRGAGAGSLRAALQDAGSPRPALQGVGSPLPALQDAGSPRPILMVGQRGTSVALSVRLRGADLRLPGPGLALQHAFGAGADSGLTVGFRVTPGVLSLTALQGAEVRRAELPLSLGLGWTLFQTVLHTGTWKAAAMSFVWMFMLALPVGYWCALAGNPGEWSLVRVRGGGGGSSRRDGEGVRGGDDARPAGAGASGMRRAAWASAHSGGTRPGGDGAPALHASTTVALGAAVLAGALWFFPRASGIAGCSPGEWGSAICGLASGVLFAAHTLGHRLRLDALSLDHERLPPRA